MGYKGVDSTLLIKLGASEKMGIRTIRLGDPIAQVVYRFERGALGRVEITVHQLPDPTPGCIDWVEVTSLFD